jgi:PilZ domain
MGQRREPRTTARLPVRIFGTDVGGKIFSENVFTVDISREGARLTGLHASVKAGEIVGISHGQNKSRFTVKWAGQPGSPREGQIGVQNLTPEKYIWDIAVPTAGVDPYRKLGGSERRQQPRMKCGNSIQLHPEGQAAPIWGKALDLSTGGCFVEMPMPLARGTKLRIGLWLNQTKLTLAGKVVNSRPGFGVGIQFLEVLPQDAERLSQFLKSITQIPI